MGAHEVHEAIICPISEDNPRNGEGDLIELKGGRLLLAYTDFYGGAADGSAAVISARYSEDGGTSWGEKYTLQPNTGEENVMSVSLERLASGDLGFLFLLKNSSDDCKAYLRKSSDEGQTWSEPVCATAEDGYHVVNNDRLVQLSTGRLIVPSCSYTGCYRERQNQAWTYYSDNEGATWQRSRSGLRVEGSQSGMQEPGVVELKDGTLMMIMRCDLGYVYQSFSSDGGETWSGPEPTALEAPVSPCAVKRLPTTGDLLMIWNNRAGHPESEPFSRRTPLTAALSNDEARTWHHIKNIESNRARTYCYTGITFVGDRVLLTYYLSETIGEKERVLASLKLKVLEAAWFYTE